MSKRWETSTGKGRAGVVQPGWCAGTKGGVGAGPHPGRPPCHTSPASHPSTVPSVTGPVAPTPPARMQPITLGAHPRPILCPALQCPTLPMSPGYNLTSYLGKGPGYLRLFCFLRMKPRRVYEGWEIGQRGVLQLTGRMLLAPIPLRSPTPYSS